MDEAIINEILEKFKKRFPPADNLNQASLKLTTGEITEMLFSLNPGLKIQEGNIYSFLKKFGYVFEPVEKNEKVLFYWLLRSL